jgi:Skp family chaperone for outer membrane proteins
MQAKQKSFQAELDAKQKQLVAEDQELVKQRNSVAKDAFEKKVKDFQGKAAAAQREIQTKKGQLDKAIADALGQVQEKIIAISKDVATEKSLDVVVSSSQVLYAKPELDITADVLSKLNSALPSVQVKF